MPLQRQILPIPIGGSGVDTRTEPKAVAGASLATAENVSFATPGRLTKRAGFAVPGTATTADAVAAVGDALIRITKTYASAYSSTAAIGFSSNTIDPAPISMGVDYLASTGNTATHTSPDACRAGSFDWLAAEFSSGVRVIARHTADGVVRTSIATTASVTRPRVVSVSSAAYFFYVSGTNLKFAGSSQTTGEISGSEVNVVTDLNANPLYDVAVSGSQIALTYLNTGGNIITGYVSTSGVLGSTVSNTPTATPVVLGVGISITDSSVAIAWGMDSNTTVTARIYNSSLVATTAATALDAVASGGIRNVGVVMYSTTAHVFYELGATDTWNYLVRRGTLTTSAAANSVTFMRHSAMVSKPWITSHSANSAKVIHILLGHKATLQRKIIIGRYNLSPTTGNGVSGSMFDGEAACVSSRVGFVSSAQVASDLDATIAVQLASSESTEFNEARIVRLTQGHADAYANVAVSGQLYVAGAQLDLLVPASVDSSTASASGNCEAGFHLYPEKISLSSSNSTGSLTNSGVYQYRFYWEMYDGNGAIIRSTYAGSQSITLGAADDTVQAVVHTLAHTNCRDSTKTVWLGVYRSAAGPGSIFYRASTYPGSTGTNGYLANSVTADTITFTDGMSDATLVTKATDYQSSDPVELDNIAPPPHGVIAAGNNRVFLSGMEDPNLIWVSKLRETGEALHFNDALTISVDAGDGPITGIACVQDNLVVFREHQIYLVGGDGPNNVGLGGEFTPSRIISEDVGCTEQRSIVRFPGGILFKSKKGIYQLGPDLSLAYIGAPVETYNSEAITSAVALTASHEVRFTTASRTLIYDYLAGAWATWTLPATHACLWQDQWVPMDSTSIMIPTPSTYVDRTGAGYTMAIETGWIHLAQLQSYQRLYRVLFLGGYRAGNHKPRVRLAFDYNTTWVDDLDWDNVTSTAPYQFQIKPSRQKCQAVKIRVEDVASGGTLGDSFTLSEIALEVGIKPGMKPLATTSTLV